MMTARQTWTKLLIEVGETEAYKLAAEIEAAYTIQEIQAPRQGLAMVKMRESAQQSLFYIGEVLITETKVKIGETFGKGLVREANEPFSRALAIIDAAITAELPETTTWQQTFKQLEEKLQQQQQALTCSIERTKVHFDSM